ncbi:MAG: hypothetical protein ACRBHB_10155 [Arenicella sp.]
MTLWMKIIAALGSDIEMAASGIDAQVATKELDESEISFSNIIEQQKLSQEQDNPEFI